MATEGRRTISYRGPASGAVAFVEMLDRHRVNVAYDPPSESRSQIQNPEAVTIFYHLEGSERSIGAAMADFQRSRHARTAYLTQERLSNGATNAG